MLSNARSSIDLRYLTSTKMSSPLVLYNQVYFAFVRIHIVRHNKNSPSHSKTVWLGLLIERQSTFATSIVAEVVLAEMSGSDFFQSGFLTGKLTLIIQFCTANTVTRLYIDVNDKW